MALSKILTYKSTIYPAGPLDGAQMGHKLVCNNRGIRKSAATSAQNGPLGEALNAMFARVTTAIAMQKKLMLALLVCVASAFAVLPANAAMDPVDPALTGEEFIFDSVPAQAPGVAVQESTVASAKWVALVLGERGTVEGNDRPRMAAVPFSAMAWLFGSALLGFIFLSNRARV